MRSPLDLGGLVPAGPDLREDWSVLELRTGVGAHGAEGCLLPSRGAAGLTPGRTDCPPGTSQFLEMVKGSPVSTLSRADQAFWSPAPNRLPCGAPTLWATTLFPGPRRTSAAQSLLTSFRVANPGPVRAGPPAPSREPGSPVPLPPDRPRCCPAWPCRSAVSGLNSASFSSFLVSEVPSGLSLRGPLSLPRSSAGGH